ncbi:hypothetical protein JW592_27555 [Streptomyces sp. DW4-2]|uniref:Uncharacterized protein n=2 Tax=Streptomyces spirodelae TaxID=2812904 RepID=A0ABS3X1C7_9ACTN|nr:hypothetical protein [Streptomyces spirodelae]
MPDGQELDVLVTARTRTRDGNWWYECDVILPTRRDLPDGRAEPTAAPVTVSVAAEHITPIPGESYTTVPTTGAAAGRQWLAVRTRGARGEGPWWDVHRRDCWQARGGWHRQLVTADEARTLLSEAGASRVCEVCRPDRALRTQ